MKYKRSVVLGTFFVAFIFFLAIGIYYLSLDKCPSGSFSCDGGSTCVPQRSMCNGHADCKDSMDEGAEECGETYGSKEMLLISLKTLFEMKFRPFNDTSNVCYLEYVPEECHCGHGSRLDCIKQNLKEVPKVKNASRILLSNNTIKLTNDSFKGNQYDVIELASNHIAELPFGVFHEQYQLKKLYLNGNRLKIITSNHFHGMTELKWLFLYDNLIEDFSITTSLVSLQWLQLSNNRLKVLKPFPQLPHILELFLDENLIEEIHDDTFAQLTNLQLLQLQSNVIHSISENAFLRLSDLRELDISDNHILALPSKLLQPLRFLDFLAIGYNKLKVTSDLFELTTNLSCLRLDDVDIRDIDISIFDKMINLRYIYFKKFYYCSYVPNIQICKPVSDGISSLKELISRPALRMSVWVVALATLSGNLLVLWGRFLSRDENRALSILIMNLAVADMLMGLYLLVIAIQDLRYRDVYHQFSHTWTSSWTCTCIGAIAMTSAQVSMLILAFMSVERFLLIVDPLGGHPRLTSRFAKNILLSIWMTGITIAVLPILYWRNSTRFYGTYNAMCFPLHLQEKYPIGWEYSSFIFIGINILGLIVVATVYFAMFISVYRTRRVAACSSDCEFAIRFFFIVLTNASCWAPVIILKILTFLDYELSSDFYGWLVVFIIPLNSAVNPLLYTFTTPKYRNQLAFNWKHSVNRSSNGDTESSRTSSNKNINSIIMGHRTSTHEPAIISTIELYPVDSFMDINKTYSENDGYSLRSIT